jgi:hypothetical protein
MKEPIMGLPAVVTSHHTLWVGQGSEAPHPVRYAVDGERLVCFGDGSLASVPDGARVSVSIHEIAGGPMLTTFAASMRCLTPDVVDMNALAELLAHVSLGATLDEVQSRLADERSHRRVVELVR